MNIEVGMLVRIKDSAFQATKKGGRPSYVRGHIGIVLSDAGGIKVRHKVIHCWNIEGIKEPCSDSILIIIYPDAEPADEDFQEDLKRWLDKKVTA